jgi:transposase
MGLMPTAEAAGISTRTARKWLRRFETHGERGLLDRSSRPANTRTSLDDALCERIEQLRRLRTPMRRIAAVVGRSVATVCRLLARLGPVQPEGARSGGAAGAL